MSKSLLVFGGNGFVGSAICKYAVLQGIKVVSLSRSGQPRKAEAWQSQVEYIKGDALDASSYVSLLPQTLGIIHSVGVLIDSRTPLNIRNVYQGSYEHMNRDTALKVCENIENKDIPFVYISAERGMFFSPRYLSTKREVEDYLASNRDKIPSSVVRPGFMYSNEDTLLKSVSYGIDFANFPDKIFKGIGADWVSETFVPARSLNVDLVAKVAVLSVLKEELRGNTYNVDDIERIASQYPN
jgi:nucleoside-diphosphate-sugar epimerase